MDSVLTGFDIEERRQFADLLERLVAAVDRAAAATTSN